MNQTAAKPPAWENIRGDADDYVIDSLTQLQAELERITNQVNNGIRTVKDEQWRRAPASQTQDRVTLSEESRTSW